MAQQDPKIKERVEMASDRSLLTGGGLTLEDGVQTDASLVALTLEDAEKFTLIIEKYEKRLMRYLRYFTGEDHQLAEDIFQEAMIKVYRNLNGYNPELPFSSWIYRIVRNEAFNQLRKKKLQNSVSLDSEDDENVSLLKILDSGVDIVDDLSRQEKADRIREVLQHLRPDYREMLMLRFLEDYDYNEISYVLQKPLGTVGVMVSRAKEAFKELAIKYNLLKYE